MDRPDDTDERILAELTQRARATFAEIGQIVNLSAPAVKRRVDRILDNGVIKGFTTVVDRNALRQLGEDALVGGVQAVHRCSSFCCTTNRCKRDSNAINHP